MLAAFDITRAQLGECHSILGIVFFLTYLPSGWLSDKLPTRWLMSLSMAGTGLLALWLSAAPDFAQIKLIFIGWGLTSGLTLWGALIKGTSLLAPHDQQGRFFGLLESGRGLVEALLATIGLAVFAYFLNSVGTSTSESLTAVIWFYGLVSIGFTPILFFALKTSHMEAPTQSEQSRDLRPAPRSKTTADQSKNLAGSTRYSRRLSNILGDLFTGRITAINLPIKCRHRRSDHCGEALDAPPRWRTRGLHRRLLSRHPLSRSAYADCRRAAGITPFSTCHHQRDHFISHGVADRALHLRGTGYFLGNA